MTETQFTRDEVDPIKPFAVLHHVDEIRDGEELVERYNYIVYEFESEEGFLTARTYLNEIDIVSIFGPFTSRDMIKSVDAPALETGAIDYFKRRFRQIDRFDPNTKSGNGYKTIWRWSAGA